MIFPSNILSVPLVHVFISSRLDYCNSLLYGMPEYQTMKLQRFMNASARLIYHLYIVRTSSVI